MGAPSYGARYILWDRSHSSGPHTSAAPETDLILLPLYRENTFYSCYGALNALSCVMRNCVYTYIYFSHIRYLQGPHLNLNHLHIFCNTQIRAEAASGGLQSGFMSSSATNLNKSLKYSGLQFSHLLKKKKWL